MSPITEAGVASSGPRAASKPQSENPQGQPSQERVGRAAGGAAPLCWGPPGGRGLAPRHRLVDIGHPRDLRGQGSASPGGQRPRARGPKGASHWRGRAFCFVQSSWLWVWEGRAGHPHGAEDVSFAELCGWASVGDQEAQALTLGIWSYTVNSPAQLSRRASVSASVQWASPRTPSCAEPG